MTFKSRTLIAAILVCVAANSAWAGIVNNSGSSPEDSISVPLWILDSLGSRTGLDSTEADNTVDDWGWIETYYPDGTQAASDSFAISQRNTAKLRYTAAVFSQTATYTYRKQISDLDGSGRTGTYSYIVTMRDTTLKLSTVCANGEFQLYQTNDISAKWDSTTQIPDNEIANAAFADNALTDAEVGNGVTVRADAVALSGDSTAADNAEADYDGSGYDNIYGSEIDDGDMADGSIDPGGEIDTSTSHWPITGVWANGTRTLTSVPGAGDSTVTQARLDSLKKTIQAVANVVGIDVAPKIRFVKIDGSDGADSSDHTTLGLSWEGAYATLQRALLDKFADAGPFFVFVGPGTWTEIDTIEFDNTHIIGSGAEQTVFNATGAGVPVFLVDSTGGGNNRVKHCEFAGFSVHGVSQASGSYGMVLNLVDSSVIRDCSFELLDMGIRVVAGEGNRIINNTVRYCDQDGIWLNSTMGQIVSGNIVQLDSVGTGGTASTGTDGITAAKRSIITSNFVACSSGSSGAAISELSAITSSWRSMIMGNYGWQYEEGSTPTYTFRRTIGSGSKWSGNFGPTRIPFVRAGFGGSSNFTDDSTGNPSVDLAWLDQRSRPDSIRSLLAENTSDSVMLGKLAEWVGNAGSLADTIEFIAGAIDAVRDSMDEASAAGSGLDSATTSRIVRRTVWGIPLGAAGSSDSVAATLRYVVGTGGGGNCGAGSQTVTLCARDTSGVDAFVQGAQISLYTSSTRSAASLYASMSTLTGGCFPSFNLNASTTYYYSITRVGYVFDTNNFTTGSGGTWGDTLDGYDSPIGSPSAGSNKRVYVYLRNGALPIVGAELKVELKAPVDSTALPYDSVTGATYVYNIPVVDTGMTTNANGYAHVDLPLNQWSIKPNGTRWLVSIVYKKQVIFGPVEMNLTTTTSDCLHHILGLGSCP